MNNKYVKTSVEEKDIHEAVSTFLKILDKNEIAIDEITFSLVRKDGTKFDFKCFEEFKKFADDILGGKKTNAKSSK